MTGSSVTAAPGTHSALVGTVVDTIVVTGLIVLACTAFGPAYGDGHWLVTALGGSVLGAVIGAATAIARWPWWTAEIGVILAYFVFGAALAAPSTTIGGVIPSVESLRILAVGAVSSWKQMLTVTDPIGISGALLVPVLITAMLAGVVAMSICARTTLGVLALVVPVVVLAIAALLGTTRADIPFVTGTAIGVGGLLWASWRQSRTAGGLDWQRPLSALAVLVVAASVAYISTPSITGESRVALRTYLTPPFDPLDYPSPLSAFRKYVKADEKTPMLTVSGLPMAGRLRLATLDAYSGIVFNVSNDSGAFRKVGDQINGDSTGTAVQLDVTVDGYQGVWLPDTGSLTTLAFGGSDGAALTDSFRYAPGTGTGAVGAGLQTGDRYRMSAVIPVVPDPTALTAVGIGSARLDPVGKLPEKLVAAALRYSQGKDSAYAKVAAIEDYLSTSGLLSHGRDSDQPSPSGHGFDRLTLLFDGQQMVGDEEQFAPAMALMVRSLDIPARVVLGFKAPANYSGTGDLVLTGGDITAWVEVDFDEFGWVPFYPLPTATPTPQDAPKQNQAQPQPQVVQPPPPAQDAQSAKSKAVNDHKNDSTDDQQPGGGFPWLVVGLAAGLPLLLVVAPIAVILFLKARRRRQRLRGQPPDRIAGGWSQLVDRAVDLGYRSPPRLTRVESAVAVDAEFGTDTVLLAREADAGVFGPEALTHADVGRFWAEMEAAAKGLGAARSRWERLGARVSLASLRRKA